ncbi:MAG TPA: acetoacetate--CoA ligase [Solirubrobacteraceae bacterium]|jgi:acetoacetyl-CoA synthetase|nr:acetoacetate--CoA ligase [Solirubrobacteraceae bacterium]
MARGDLLWTPSAEMVERAAMTRFMRSLDRGFTTYDDLWRWSVDDLDGFWAAIWEHFGVRGSYDAVLADRSMPGARWFPGARVNYAEHMLRERGRDDQVAIVHRSELRPAAEVTWAELREQVERCATGLRRLGVGEGDRVVAYLPNVPETIVAFLATASLGAIWSSAAPEFGLRSVVDRFAQIEPKVLLTIDGYRYGGRDFDRREIVEGLLAELPTVEHTVRLRYLGTGDDDWAALLADREPLDFARVPFDHPLWVLYSSGTTGLPKAIVHGHGGILLEHLKKMHLHLDAQPGDRVFWFTTTGWMMWNFLVGVLLTDATILLYDGNPAGDVLWDFASETGMTCFGTSAAYIAACMKQGVEPRAGGRDLDRLRSVGSTGSPLAPEGFRWVYDHVGEDTWLFSTSGGTDVCTAFVGGVPLLPVYEGELQARALGAKVEAWDEEGRPLTGRVGELVITEPMPSMPVFFWNDPDGTRLHESYFDVYPGVWRHGDWIEITSRGTAVISGRSDSTINRGGVRMGTSEIYRAVLALDDVVDALVVDLDDYMPLFVVLREGATLDDDLRARIARRIREDCSPRHVPNEVREIAEVPRTLSGKALEVPVKRILMGVDPERAASRDSLANPAALDPFVELAGAFSPQA